MTLSSHVGLPPLGCGIGLRPKHFGSFLGRSPLVDWVEATSENFMIRGGRPRAVLAKVRRDLPVALHGVSLSVGSTEPLNMEYLSDLRELVRWVEPAIVSDHLSWGSHGGRYGHDLWPLPFTEEAIVHVTSRIDQVQEHLGRQILIENVSSYVAYRDSTLREWEFLSEIAVRADCGILLDVNNVYVSSKNHGFDAREYLEGVPAARVAEIHLAGHADKGEYLLDSHDAPVADAVWSLYRRAVERFGRIPTLIEWDDQIPELDVLVAEAEKASSIQRHVLDER